MIGRAPAVDGFDALRRAVLEDPALQVRLGVHRDWETFLGRLPSWVDLRGMEIDAPSYSDVVQHAVAEPYRLLFRSCTTTDALTAPSACDDEGDPLELAGLIFHTSRCGSTLICRMLAEVPGTVVISEPPIVDQLLRAPGVPEKMRGRWVAAAVAALTRHIPEAQRAVFKLDAWASAHLGLLRSVFPHTPWVFVHREPAEVVASRLRVPGMTCARGMVPPHLFDLDLDLEHALRMPSEEYCATVIAAILTHALGGLDDAGRLVGYKELPEAVLSRILPHFMMQADDAVREAMMEVAERDAKRPHQRFDPAAVATPTAAVIDACRRHAEQPYISLRAISRAAATPADARW